MREVAAGLRTWRAEGRSFALATVVRTWSSAPRVAGAVMAVDVNGEVLGSVSGGCVEAAVHELALRVLESGRPELCRFGVTADDAFAVGLTCGGEIEIYVEPAGPAAFAELDAVLAALGAGEPVRLITVIGEPAVGQPHHRVLIPDAGEGAPISDTASLQVVPGGGSSLVQDFAAPARMIVFGAVDFADALTRVGRFLGYRVTLCDARPVFATSARFPDADEVVVAWPHRYLATQSVDASTVLCVLTHDPKFDLPLLEAALATEAGYIGVMGNRQTHAERLQQLAERGVAATALARLRAPIGLDLGAKSPAETAISIAAEIVAARNHRSGLPLRELAGPIHDSELSALLCDR